MYLTDHLFCVSVFFTKNKDNDEIKIVKAHNDNFYIYKATIINRDIIKRSANDRLNVLKVMNNDYQKSLLTNNSNSSIIIQKGANAPKIRSATYQSTNDLYRDSDDDDLQPIVSAGKIYPQRDTLFEPIDNTQMVQSQSQTRNAGLRSNLTQKTSTSSTRPVPAAGIGAFSYNEVQLTRIANDVEKISKREDEAPANTSHEASQKPITQVSHLQYLPQPVVNVHLGNMSNLQNKSDQLNTIGN